MAEQPDKKQVIKLIANSLQRLSKLYQIPNWTEENAVYLGEWIFDNYKFDSLDDVIACLANPPQTYDEQGKIESNWRLTPDRIQKWMAIQLEKTAIKLEAQHNELKNSNNQEIQGVNYQLFKDRIAKEGLPKKSRGWDDMDYKVMRSKRKQYESEHIENGKIKPDSPTFEEWLKK